MHKCFIVLLAFLLLYLQARLWLGAGSVAEIIALTKKIDQQQHENDRLTQRNEMLTHEVIELQNGLQTLEAVARQELGMIKRDEKFYVMHD